MEICLNGKVNYLKTLINAFRSIAVYFKRLKYVICILFHVGSTFSCVLSQFIYNARSQREYFQIQIIFRTGIFTFKKKKKERRKEKSRALAVFMNIFSPLYVHTSTLLEKLAFDN